MSDIDGAYEAYERHPLDELDEWGDLASFHEANLLHRQQLASSDPDEPEWEWLPNADTAEALQQAQTGTDLVEYPTLDDLKARMTDHLDCSD